MLLFLFGVFDLTTFSAALLPFFAIVFKYFADNRSRRQANEHTNYKIEEIHILVNSQKEDLERRVRALQLRVKELEGDEDDSSTLQSS